MQSPLRGNGNEQGYYNLNRRFLLWTMPKFIALLTSKEEAC